MQQNLSGCASELHTDERGWQALQATVAKIKEAGKGKDFDCIMGMSGGVDRFCLTHVAKEKVGLRQLVVHGDAVWKLPAAVNNIEKLVDGLSLINAGSGEPA